MHEIKIYGEIVPANDKYITEDGEGGYCTLAYLQKQLKEAGGKPVKVRINSFGGDVNAGFAMYAELRRYAKQHKVMITTFGEAYVASIATVIFLAGDVRILTAQTHPFVHNAWYETAGDAKHMAEAAKELDRASDMIAEHYAAHTNLSYKVARQLMDAETYITIEEAIAMRFATAVEHVQRPKALSRFIAQNRINKQNKEDMSKPKSVLAALYAFLKTHGAMAKEVTTADELVIVFPDVAEDADVAIGDMATVDGQPAEGSYVMKTGETYVFVAGELTEIIEEEEEELALDEEAVKASDTYKTLEASYKALEETSVKTLEIAEGLQAKIATLTAATSKPAPVKNRQAPAANKAPEKEVKKVASALADIKKRTLALGAK